MRIEDMISVTCAAQIRGVSETYIRMLLREGRIKGVKLGRDWLVSEASVRALRTRPYNRRDSTD